MTDTLPPSTPRRLGRTAGSALVRSAVTFARVGACLLLAWPACTASTADDSDGESSESALSGRTLTVTNPGTQTAGVAFRATVKASYPLDVAKLQETDNSGGPEFVAIPAGYTLSADKETLTFPLSNGSIAPHPLQLRDLSSSPALVSNLVTYDVEEASNAPPSGGTTLSLTNPGTQTAGVPFKATVKSSYAMSLANMRETDSSGGTDFVAMPAGSALSSDGKTLTFPLSNGNTLPHPLQVEDISKSPPLLSNLVTYDVVTAGSGGGGSGGGGTPGCQTAAWDPSSWEGAPWKLTDGDRTATSPDNNVEGSINVNFGSPSIPDKKRTYFEITVSGAELYTAFVVGFGVHGANLSNVNYCAEGQTISNASSVLFGYNDGIAISGSTIYDPGDDGDRCNKTEPPPNTWHDGDVIGVRVDRVDNTFSFTRNGQAQGGTFSMPGIAGKTFYPLVSSWYKSGPVATINGAASPPAGYVSLDQANCD